MTKIVKTIDKVTNHENMRRYVHMKLSNGGSGSGSGSESVIYVHGTKGEGTHSYELDFTPNEDQITFDDACALYLAGYSVMLTINDGSFCMPVIGYAQKDMYENDEVSFYAIFTDGSRLRWFKPDGNSE